MDALLGQIAAEKSMPLDTNTLPLGVAPRGANDAPSKDEVLAVTFKSIGRWESVDNRQHLGTTEWAGFMVRSTHRSTVAPSCDMGRSPRLDEGPTVNWAACKPEPLSLIHI